MNNIITLSGDPGSGKSTVRDSLKAKFEMHGKTVKIYCVGDIFRQLAEEKGMTVTEFNKMLEKKNTNVDEQLDLAVAKFGEKIERENNPNIIYIIDSRMAWKNIPNAYKVKLTVTDRIAGERIFNDRTRGKEDQYNSLEETIIETKVRKKSEKERYFELYGEDITDDKNFDININTAFVSPEDIADVIIENMSENTQNKGLIWASPKLFLPTQAMGDTIHTFSDLQNSIKQEGFQLRGAPTAMKKGNMYWILDGHHRNFAAASVGINIIPYTIYENMDEKEEYTINEQIGILEDTLGINYRSVLYTYEEVWRNHETRVLTYGYEKAYPGIYGLQQDVNIKRKSQDDGR